MLDLRHRLLTILSPGLILWLAAVPAARAGEEEVRAPWDERDAVAEFLERGVAVGPLRAEVEVAKAGSVGSGSWPNPEVSLEREQVFSTAGGSENRLRISVPVPLGRLGLERDMATRAGEIAGARADGRLQELVAEFRSALSRTYFAEAREAAMRTALATYDDVERIVSARVASGEEARYDLQRVRLARTTAGARLEGQMATAQEARLTIALALGRPVTAPIRLTAVASRLPGHGDLASRIEGHPALAALRLERERTQRAHDLAEARRWPDPALALGLKEAGGFGYTAGISWPLPLFERQQGALASADAEGSRLKAEESAVRTRLAVEAAQALASVRGRRAAADSFATNAMTKLGDLLRTAQIAYREGQAPILTVLDAHEAALAAQLEHLGLLESAHEAELRLDRALGADRRNP
jgi:cobalt-zinc-cadmium efflux system outer membrane protein